MFKRNHLIQSLTLTVLFLFSFIFSSCTTNTNETEPVPPAQNTTDASSVPTVAPTPTITPIPEPLALRVNGEGISLDEYNAMLGILAVALDEENTNLTAEEAEERVLNQFIEVELLAQAARVQGYMIDEAQLDAKIAELAAEAGGEEAFSAWMATYALSETVFRRIYQRELEAAWQRDQITAAIGATSEQIHARQIQVSSQETANQVYSQLKGGSDFATLAVTYDPLTKGDLGWFPRGYLFLPEVEEILFALQPGAYSEVIQTDVGYHIFQVVERGDRALSTNARRVLMHNALDEWINTRLGESQVEILLP